MKLPPPMNEPIGIRTRARLPVTLYLPHIVVAQPEDSRSTQWIGSKSAPKKVSIRTESKPCSLDRAKGNEVTVTISWFEANS